jgi:hypothetical protein
MELVISTGDDKPEVMKLLNPITGWAWIVFPGVKNETATSRIAGTK